MMICDHADDPKCPEGVQGCNHAVGHEEKESCFPTRCYLGDGSWLDVECVEEEEEAEREE